MLADEALDCPLLNGGGLSSMPTFWRVHHTRYPAQFWPKLPISPQSQTQDVAPAFLQCADLSVKHSSQHILAIKGVYYFLDFVGKWFPQQLIAGFMANYPMESQFMFDFESRARPYPPKPCAHRGKAKVLDNALLGCKEEMPHTKRLKPNLPLAS